MTSKGCRRRGLQAASGSSMRALRLDERSFSVRPRRCCLEDGCGRTQHQNRRRQPSESFHGSLQDRAAFDPRSSEQFQNRSSGHFLGTRFTQSKPPLGSSSIPSTRRASRSLSRSRAPCRRGRLQLSPRGQRCTPPRRFSLPWRSFSNRATKKCFSSSSVNSRCPPVGTLYGNRRSCPHSSRGLLSLPALQPLLHFLTRVLRSASSAEVGPGSLRIHHDGLRRELRAALWAEPLVPLCGLVAFEAGAHSLHVLGRLVRSSTASRRPRPCPSESCRTAHMLGRKQLVLFFDTTDRVRPMYPSNFLLLLSRFRRGGRGTFILL